MGGFKLFVSLLLLASTLIAQEIPAGTVIPVMLQTTLDARSAKAGQKIKARVMQDVSLSSQTQIRAGSKLIGRVVDVTRPTAPCFAPTTSDLSWCACRAADRLRISRSWLRPSNRSRAGIRYQSNKYHRRKGDGGFAFSDGLCSHLFGGVEVSGIKSWK